MFFEKNQVVGNCSDPRSDLIFGCSMLENLDVIFFEGEGARVRACEAIKEKNSQLGLTF